MILSLLVILMSFNAAAYSIKNEIQILNKEYGRSLEHPIFILDKEDISAYLKSLDLKQDVTQGEKERNLIQAMMVYIFKRFDYKMSPEDVNELIPYVTEVNTGASAMPFFVDTVHHKMKLCIVLPADHEPDHMKEIERITGADPKPELFKNVDLKKLATIMPDKETKLLSLYHELSHCMDTQYLPQMYSAETDPWAVHKAEAFAEINGLFLLSQRHDMNNLGYARNLVRSVYSKHSGPFLANADPSPFTNIVVKAAGTSYFFMKPLMKSQELISADPQKIKALPLADLLKQSQKIIDQYALSQFSAQALRDYLQNGREAALAQYKKLSDKSSRMFGAAYADLQEIDVWLNSLEERIATYPQQ